VRATFDDVAERLGDDRPFLCGERFTAADLTFAALSAAVLMPPEYGVPLPQPAELPTAMAATVRNLREHPAGAYALKLFREERHS
jgi:glutathione S-transferase